MSSGNSSLLRASQAKQDEFYTQITDIEKELSHYTEHFRGKTIFCNCDDPESSNFWKYFQLNFYRLGLKKLISTHYHAVKPTYKMEIVSTDKDIQVGIPDYVKTPLSRNGDFRSPECIEILKEADIVITNPPFSLFRDYVGQLIKYNKKFIIIGSQNGITYKEIFPLIKDNKMWLGYHSGDMAFTVPDYYEERTTRYWIDEMGQKWRSMGNICWYTNLDIPKRHEELTLYRTYNAADYPTYANYDAIEVGKVADIPADYYREMGVPLTYLSVHNPDQFEIIGSSLWLGKAMKEIAEKGTYVSGGKRFYLREDNGDLKYRRLYDRIVIRRKLKEGK